MKSLLLALAAHPRLTSTLGAISGWFSVETIARAKDVMQLGAATLAAAVSLCALILTAPAAWAKVRTWLHRARQRQFPLDLE
jgi:hypothetical protein